MCICDVPSALVCLLVTLRSIPSCFFCALPYVLPACVGVVFEEPVGVRVGVSLFSLSATLASVFSSRCCNVLWTNRVQSCLSVSARLGFLSSFCSSFLSCWRWLSILVISSSFVLMTVFSNERPASFSACLLLRLIPPLPVTTCGLFLVQCCAREGQLYIYLDCL